MSGKVLSRKVHRDGTSTVIRLIEDPQPVRRTGNPLARLMESCRQVEAAAARIQASLKPGSPKPSIQELAAGIVASKRRGGINRFARNAGGAAIVSQPRQVTKAPAPQPKPYEPDEAAVTALRAAFGLGIRRDQVEGTRKTLIQDTRAAEKRVKDAASAKPQIIDGETGGAVVHNPPSTGDRGRIVDEPAHYAQVWNAIHKRVNAAGRMPVVLSAAEIARELGLTVTDVNNAIDALWRTGQLQRYGRPGGPVRWATTQ
jgi:hypothetical protein